MLDTPPGIRLASWCLAASGVGAAVAALSLDQTATRSAAAQVWSPFVLVAGLLLVGQVADDDGLFAAVGYWLAAHASNGAVLFGGAAVIIAVVTALLNLDTSVVFLTPVLVHAARSRDREPASMLVACLLLSNTGSLLLPGSNLTNLIVLGHLHLSGGQFLHRMALPWAASVLLTGSVIALVEQWATWRRRNAVGGSGTGGAAGGAAGGGGGTGACAPPTPSVRATAEHMSARLGVAAVVAVTGLVLVLRSPAIPVLAVGVLAIGIRLIGRRDRVAHVVDTLGIPVLVGLFGIATALGTLGRAWSGPAMLLSHLDAIGSALVAAASSVLVNNLPAAALLAARVPPHPFALLVGLDIGPNLFVTGSLAWILWWRTAHAAGAKPPVGRAVVLGLVTVPLSMAAALAMLAVTGPL
ncbi:MAG: SLC13 family permease, partial [Acidimicrobiales bacterium]